MKTIFSKALFTLILSLTSFSVFCQSTQIQYLSGTGSDHTTTWQFFCTQGQNSGKWTTIPVPSCWELQGFGKYNYGHAKDSLRGMESGLYKYSFQIPQTWSNKTIYIVFEGVMTDAQVKINGKIAGPLHQGAYYQFRYRIDKLLSFTKPNILEVSVAKHSANETVNKAERRGDFWIFGGIFRPVYLEASPENFISRVEIDAQANGKFKANVITENAKPGDDISAQVFTLKGEPVGSAFKSKVEKGKNASEISTNIANPKLWSPEEPNLYNVKFTLSRNGKNLHSYEKRFGFRTVEFRLKDGIYINNVAVKFKGVNRHCFWPTTGRATNKEQSIADVKLMKDMNMNAVRMSHYPPDSHFLDACDSLGLFVLDELAGWHGNYDTPTGTKLTQDMIAHDINHPSIVIWCNGNEGGHNFDLDPVFDNADIQKRPVIHPWQLFRGIDTQHYINYDYGNSSFFQGHDVFFPTEFLHGNYDGGHGAGLSDYWEAMWSNPLSAGGFLWVFADEGVVRTDMDGFIDTDVSHAPDGIVGPFHEKEGSYFAIKEVWSPVKFLHKEITPAFDGTFSIENRYLYTNLKNCTFNWKLVKFNYPEVTPAKELTGIIPSPDITPFTKGLLKASLPSDWNSFDILYITANNPDGTQIFTWSWPVKKPSDISKTIVKTEGTSKPLVKEQDSLLIISVNNMNYTFNRNNGLLFKVMNQLNEVPFTNGPVLCDGINDFKGLNYKYDGNNLIIEGVLGKNSNYKSATWTIFPSGWMKLYVEYFPKDYESDFLGVSFSFPEKEIKSVTWMGNGPYRVWKNRMQGGSLNVWSKDYNNTITGESQKLIYPEFKGYHSNLYWAKFITTGTPFTVVTDDEDMFLRLFTPPAAKEPANTAPAFPTGDISFLQAIPPIGTRTQKAENMGPSGKKNMYFDYWKDRPKKMTLFFNFSGNN
jgi:hypothetical protein